MSWSLALISGLLYGLAFPPFNFSFLAWICLIPLLIIPIPNRRTAFGYFYFAGLIANLLIFFWLWKTCRSAEVGVLTTIGVWFSLSGLLALYFGLFGVFITGLPRFARPWLAGGIWVGLDWVKGTVLTGFPWAFLAHTQTNHLALIQIAAVAGTSAVTFLIVVFNLAFSQLISATKNKKRLIINLNKDIPINIIVLSVILGAVIFVGSTRLSKASKAQPAHIKVALLQGNIDQYQKWDRQYEGMIKKVYENLAHKAAQEKPDLMVWPESALPGWYPNDLRVQHWVTSLAKATKTPQLFGAVSREYPNDYNSAFLIDAQGKIQGQYRKEHLVPFGEYIPFGRFMTKFIPYLGQLGTFQSGEDQELFIINGTRWAPNICYEAIFPNLVRDSVNLGADIIVNLTNDGWYLDTGAPEQHYRANIFRAIENGRSVVRCANTGISAVIDPTGREVMRSPLLRRGAFVAEVPYSLSPEQTPFVKMGNWFVWLCVGGVLIFSFVYSRACRAS